MIYAGKTDKGMVRTMNQDEYAAGALPDGAVFAVVCDGMGGANGGNVASSSAVKIIRDAIQNEYKEDLDIYGLKKLLTLAIGRANTEVYTLSRSESALFGMGTTVVAAVAREDAIIVAHAGDSRAYLVSDEIRQMTRDHSIVQEMLENGKITEEEALSHPQKNIITRAVGVEESIDIDFNSAQFHEDDTLLICSDGLSNLVADDILYTVVKRDNPERCVDTLVGMANENGGSDNITVVAIRNVQTGGEMIG